MIIGVWMPSVRRSWRTSKSIFFGKEDIKENEIKIARPYHLLTTLSVGGDLDFVAFCCQTFFDEACNLRFIFDEEYVHGKS